MVFGSFISTLEVNLSCNLLALVNYVSKTGIKKKAFPGNYLLRKAIGLATETDKFHLFLTCLSSWKLVCWRSEKSPITFFRL